MEKQRSSNLNIIFLPAKMGVRKIGTLTIDKMMKYIDEHIKDEIRLIELSKLIGYSPWHLYKMFKKYSDVPIMEYIRQKRLFAAIQEFTQGRSLYDIALDYGFETQAGFYKAFQKTFNCSPNEFKKHEIRGSLKHNTPRLHKVSKEIGDNEMENLIIRQIQQSDSRDVWENIFSRNTPVEVEERIADSLQKIAAGIQIQLVAIIDGHVIGTMKLEKEQHPLRRHSALLGDVVVNPAFQRMGIAKRLFEESKKYAIERDISLIKVNCRGNTPAETVYRKLGFIEAGRIPNAIIEPWGEKHCFDEVLFYLSLNN